jgi:hypothetical protein
MKALDDPRDRSNSARGMKLKVVSLALIAGGASFWSLHSTVALSGEQTVADTVASGRRLLAENGCNGACHQARVGGRDPSTLYTQVTRRVNSREELRQQVDVCVSRLNAMIFPDDIEAVVSALDHDGYHFE